MSWLPIALGVAIINLVLAELFDWSDWLAERLIARAARRLPTDQRDRWRDDWLAELENLPGKHVSHLLWAMSLMVKSGRMARALGSRPSRLSATSRRAIDVTVAITLLVLAGPLLLVLALAIKLESPGPIFYFESRTGRGGKPTRVTRFRTLPSVGYAERYTPVGRYVRRQHLNELPQLFDVVRGDVSLVEMWRQATRPHDW